MSVALVSNYFYCSRAHLKDRHIQWSWTPDPQDLTAYNSIKHPQAQQS